MALLGVSKRFVSFHKKRPEDDFKTLRFLSADLRRSSFVLTLVETAGTFHFPS